MAELKEMRGFEVEKGSLRSKICVSDDGIFINSIRDTRLGLFLYLKSNYPTSITEEIWFDDVLTTRQYKFIQKLHTEPSFDKANYKENSLMVFIYTAGYLIHLENSLYAGFCYNSKNSEDVEFFTFYPDAQEVKFMIRDYMVEMFSKWFNELDSNLIEKYY